LLLLLLSLSLLLLKLLFVMMMILMMPLFNGFSGCLCSGLVGGLYKSPLVLRCIYSIYCLLNPKVPKGIRYVPNFQSQKRFGVTFANPFDWFDSEIFEMWT
jgi:hypothetical protein